MKELDHSMKVLADNRAAHRAAN